MIAIKCERADLIAVVLARNRQNRLRNFLKLVASWHHRVVIPIGGWMLENALEIRGRISDKRIEALEGNVFLVGIQKFGAPEFLITKKIVLRGAAAGEGEPLHIVSFADVLV